MRTVRLLALIALLMAALIPAVGLRSVHAGKLLTQDEAAEACAFWAKEVAALAYLRDQGVPKDIMVAKLLEWAAQTEQNEQVIANYVALIETVYLNPGATPEQIQAAFNASCIKKNSSVKI